MTAPPPMVPNRPVRVVLVGDSTAEATGAGLLSWSGAHPDLASVLVRAAPGCGMLLDGFVDADGQADFTTQCLEILDEALPEDVATMRPDVIAIMVTLHDVIDRQWDRDEGTISPLDRRYQGRLLAAYRARVADFHELGIPRIVWVIPPVPDFYWDGVSSQYEEPARFDVQRATILAAAEGDPSIRVVDMRRWAEETGLAADRQARPDGLHWSPEAASALAEDWLGQQLIDAALT